MRTRMYGGVGGEELWGFPLSRFAGKLAPAAQGTCPAISRSW